MGNAPEATTENANLTPLDPEIVRGLVAELTEHDHWSRIKLINHQQNLLAELLRHATTHSPYYRDTIASYLEREAAFETFPILTKSQLVANFDCIVTDRRLRLNEVESHLAGPNAGALLFGQYRACATGGTSGERAILVYDQASWELGAANALRFMRALEIGPETRVLGIGAPTPLHISNRMFAELRAGRSSLPRLAVTSPLPEVVAGLNAFQPEALVTYPSFMRRLVEEKSEGRLKISPRLICSIAEALTDDVRNLVHDTWNIRVIDGYGTTETGMRGMECLHVAGIHLPEDLIIYEVVDDENRNVPVGRAGRKVLITTLTNKVLPLIRYELSDIVTLADGACACGRPYIRIAKIEGRREETLCLPSREGGCIEIHAGRLRSPLIRTPGIRQFQIVQGNDHLTIMVSIRDAARGEEISAAIRRDVQDTLARAGVAEIDLRIQLVESIALAGTGAKEKLLTRSS